MYVPIEALWVLFALLVCANHPRFVTGLLGIGALGIAALYASHFWSWPTMLIVAGAVALALELGPAVLRTRRAKAGH